MFSFLTRRGFIKQNSGDIEYAVARTIVLHIAGKKVRYIKDQTGVTIKE